MFRAHGLTYDHRFSRHPYSALYPVVLASPSLNVSGGLGQIRVSAIL